MPSDIFNNLLDEQINLFKDSFSNQSREIFVNPTTGKIIHPGEYGMYREQVCRNFLKFFTPSNFNIDTGFVITENNEVSTQCDIVIFDPSHTPLIRNDGLQRFFPIETSVAIGEIKSTLNKSDLFTALKKLSIIKKYRKNITSPNIVKDNHNPIASRKFDPAEYSYDQIITFLICDQFSFNTSNLSKELTEFYDSENIDYLLRHNAILSLTDGLWFYHDKNLTSHFYPFSRGTYYKNRACLPELNSNSHIRLFCNGFFIAAASSVILHPELSNYLGSMGRSKFIDQDDVVEKN